LTVKKMFQPEVVEVKECSKDIFLLRFYEPYIAQNSKSGQFVEIVAPRRNDILWRRPFSIHNTDSTSGIVDILFHAVGRGTEALAHLEKGEQLDVLGPLGRSFQYENNLQEAILVAGGLGIAPFKLMHQELSQKGVPMTLFYGVGSVDQFCDLDFYKAHTNLQCSTVDGSFGHHGLITELLLEYLQTMGDRNNKTVYVCGPTPMMRRVQEIVQEYKVDAQVTLETIMACGFGACVGCAVRMAKPQPGVKEYYLACKDGPVFNMEEIIIDD
jgi:dihydroorotate dehydrogenase electron transfer subunit